MLDEEHAETYDGDGDRPDADAVSSRRQLASYAVRSSYGEFRRSGVHQVGSKSKGGFSHKSFVEMVDVALNQGDNN